MSAPGADDAMTLSTASESDNAQVTSSPRPHAPDSLLDDWEHWPENHPNYDPAFDGAWLLRQAFCENKSPQCLFCSETRQILHVSEYTAHGQSVMEKKVNTKELHEHLQELERLDMLDAKTANHPSVRLFFACSNYVHGNMRFAFMRHFFAYCRIPPRFVIRTHDIECHPAFQSLFETRESNTPCGPQRGILHIYLQCFARMVDTDILAHPEYFSTAFVANLLKYTKGSDARPFSSSLYIRYDESSRETLVYVAEDTRSFHHLRSIFSTDGQEAKQDPFLLVAIFLHHRLAELHRFVRERKGSMVRARHYAYKLHSLDTDSSVVFQQFGNLCRDGPDIARIAQGAASMLRAIGAIEAEHRLFLEREGTYEAQAYAARAIWPRFQQQRAHLVEIESSLSALVKGIEIVIEVMASRAQLLNGIDMAKMARDNQKQAVATETLARDARRDSEIMKRDSATMKTITVVTLVYLPATFVSTLLSMGLFDFGVDNGGNGRLRVAREGWVFLAISLPLTILTLALAFLWKQYKERQWTREAAEAKAAAAAAKERQEKSVANGGDGAPQVLAPEPPASVDAAPASRWQPLLARLPHLRRRPAPQEARGSETETV